VTSFLHFPNEILCALLPDSGDWRIQICMCVCVRESVGHHHHHHLVALVSLITRGEKRTVNVWPLHYVISFVRHLGVIFFFCVPMHNVTNTGLWHFKLSSPWTWRLLPSLTRVSVQYRCRLPTESECSTALELTALASAHPVVILGLLEPFPCFTLVMLVLNWGWCCCCCHTEFLGFCIWGSESN
jgi:hypothetical protein